MSTSQAYQGTLALISNTANYLKYTYLLDYDGIDNVTLRLWTFSDFCSRHTVGVAGDDIMFHILVLYILDALKLHLSAAYALPHNICYAVANFETVSNTNSAKLEIYIYIYIYIFGRHCTCSWPTTARYKGICRYSDNDHQVWELYMYPTLKG